MRSTHPGHFSDFHWEDKEFRHMYEAYIAVAAALTLAMLIGGFFLL